MHKAQGKSPCDPACSMKTPQLLLTLNSLTGKLEASSSSSSCQGGRRSPPIEKPAYRENGVTVRAEISALHLLHSNKAPRLLSSALSSAPTHPSCTTTGPLLPLSAPIHTCHPDCASDPSWAPSSWASTWLIAGSQQPRKRYFLKATKAHHAYVYSDSLGKLFFFIISSFLMNQLTVINV